MARYRLSSHDLNMERERFNNPITPMNQRICTTCELNKIDDEIHLLLHCSAMNNEREILFNYVAAIINIHPKNDMFLRVIRSRDITVVKSLAQFIYGCLNKLKVKIVSIINQKSPVAILSILSCFHDLTWVLPHIRTAVALGFYYLAFYSRLGTFPSPLLSDGVGPYGEFQSCYVNSFSP